MCVKQKPRCLQKFLSESVRISELQMPSLACSMHVPCGLTYHDNNIWVWVKAIDHLNSYYVCMHIHTHIITYRYNHIHLRSMSDYQYYCVDLHSIFDLELGCSPRHPASARSTSAMRFQVPPGKGSPILEGNGMETPWFWITFQYFTGSMASMDGYFWKTWVSRKEKERHQQPDRTKWSFSDETLHMPREVTNQQTFAGKAGIHHQFQPVNIQFCLDFSTFLLDNQ